MNNTPSQPAGGPDRPGKPDRPAGPSQQDTGRSLIPLTVWQCADSTGTGKDAGWQAGQDRPGCPRHRPGVGGQLARHLIAHCTGGGDTVLDVYPASEAVMVAAARAGRRAVGCVPHLPLARHLGARIRAQLPHEALPRVALRQCSPDQMAFAAREHIGRAALVVAEPPPLEATGRVPKPAKDCPACRADLWTLSRERLHAVLVNAYRMLRPGGVLAVVTTARHDPSGRLIDPASRIIRTCTGLGFTYVQHVIALRVPVEGDSLLVQVTPAVTAHLPGPRASGLPPVISVHADVSILVKPAARGYRRRGGGSR